MMIQGVREVFEITNLPDVKDDRGDAKNGALEEEEREGGNAQMREGGGGGKLVFIGRDLDQGRMRASLEANVLDVKERRIDVVRKDDR